jgi:hypothetical protein
MTWLLRAQGPHECDLPAKWFRRRGRRWQCEECEEIWQIADPSIRNTYRHYNNNTKKRWYRESQLPPWRDYEDDYPRGRPSPGYRLHPGEYCGCKPCEQKKADNLQRKLEKEIGISPIRELTA